MKTLLLRGVPPSVAMDGWWLSSSEPPTPRPRNPASECPLWPVRAGALAGLIALADYLLWQVTAPGLALAVFGMALLGAAWALAGRRGTAGLGIAAVLSLPVVETVQLLSLGFWLVGLVWGAAWIAVSRWPGLAAGMQFLLHAPLQVLADLRSAAHSQARTDLRGGLNSVYLGWFLPVGVGFLFLSLLIAANPVLEGWIDGLLQGPALLAPERVAFWLGVAVLIWPFLSLRSMVQRLSLGIATPRPLAIPAIVNAASVRRSLLLFNAVFAVQTLSDIAIFSGGASLPQGMSYAEYAHRGAYPLLATALLAGMFALVARPFTQGNPALRLALLGWMAQTLLLTISSLFRLESYVSVFGLTYLRLAALIWMGLVAVGISLVIGQILHGRSAGWLLRRCAWLGAVTLYVCSLTSFSATIARFNLSHDVVLDRAYICGLDAAALPAILADEAATGRRLCSAAKQPVFTPAGDWREWGFRGWRTARSLPVTYSGKVPAWQTY